jgi:hypothetical protein
VFGAEAPFFVSNVRQTDMYLRHRRASLSGTGS